MISTEQEARAAVAKLGGRCLSACNEVVERCEYGKHWTPAILLAASRDMEHSGHPRLAKSLKRLGAEWAVNRGRAS